MRRPTPPRALAGQVAIVLHADSDLGRASALALAAKGVCVVVAGSNERSIGEVVGEIANGGGKARHVVGDPRAAATVHAAVEKAVSVFGLLDIAIVPIVDSDASTHIEALDAAIAPMRNGGRLVALLEAQSEIDSSASAVIREFIHSHMDVLAGCEITANALHVDRKGEPRLEPEDVGEWVTILCSRAGAVVNGEMIHLGYRAGR
jgi:hypothetical protein